MKKLALIILLLISLNAALQSIVQVNVALKIPDSLVNSEIRIYRKYGTAIGMDVFRMYKTSDEYWNVELYQYLHIVKQPGKVYNEKKLLKSSNNLNRIWDKILDTNVEFLPNINQIHYKLRSKTKYDSPDDIYGYHEVISIMDGVEYYGFVRSENRSNSFEFGNAESYLEEYPEVDELNSYSELLNILRLEFHIWKK